MMTRILSFLMISILMACAGGRNNESLYAFESDPPFEVGESYFQKWVAGTPEGGSGFHLAVFVRDIRQDLTIEKLYFRKMVSDARQDQTDIDRYKGYFKNTEGRDVVMSSDATLEAQNTPPVPFPFDLEDDQAVLSYQLAGETYFVLLESLEERPELAYPSRGSGLDEQ